MARIMGRHASWPSPPFCDDARNEVDSRADVDSNDVESGLWEGVLMCFNRCRKLLLLLPEVPLMDSANKPSTGAV